MRILLGNETYPPDVNGAAYFTRRLAEGLEERGHGVHVMCASTNFRTRTRVRKGWSSTVCVRCPFHSIPASGFLRRRSSTAASCGTQSASGPTWYTPRATSLSGAP